MTNICVRSNYAMAYLSIHMVKAYLKMLMYNEVQLETVVLIILRQRALVTQ